MLCSTCHQPICDGEQYIGTPEEPCHPFASRCVRAATERVEQLIRDSGGDMEWVLFEIEREFKGEGTK